MSVSAPVVAGSTFTATIPTPPGPPASLGARVEAEVTAAIVSSWQPSSIANDGLTCFVTLDAPVSSGSYVIHWMTSGPVSTFDAYQALVVVGTGSTATGVEWPQVAPEDVRPTVKDVALLERIRTVDRDTGAEVGTFTASTRPTDLDVKDVIDQAVDDILSELPHDAMIDPVHYRQVQRAVTFYAAMIVEGSWYKEQANERGGPTWQSEYQEALKNLQARIEEDYAQNNLLGTMEPHDSPGWVLG